MVTFGKFSFKALAARPVHPAQGGGFTYPTPQSVSAMQ